MGFERGVDLEDGAHAVGVEVWGGGVWGEGEGEEAEDESVEGCVVEVGCGVDLLGES